jgi:hypothetical protein
MGTLALGTLALGTLALGIKKAAVSDGHIYTILSMPHAHLDDAPCPLGRCERAHLDDAPFPIAQITSCARLTKYQQA